MHHTNNVYKLHSKVSQESSLVLRTKYGRRKCLFEKILSQIGNVVKWARKENLDRKGYTWNFEINSIVFLMIMTVLYASNSYTMVCLPVRGDNTRDLSSGKILRIGRTSNRTIVPTIVTKV